MILITLFYEFFKIGLFAIGGGSATIPFLFDLSEKFNWYTKQQLMNMIAVSQSTPGPIGVNLATFSGFQAAGITGGIIATLGLILPSIIVVILISKLLNDCASNPYVCEMMSTIRPAVCTIFLWVSFELFKLSITDYTSGLVALGLFGLIRYYKKSPIFYICLSAILGIILKL